MMIVLKRPQEQLQSNLHASLKLISKSLCILLWLSSLRFRGQPPVCCILHTLKILILLLIVNLDFRRSDMVYVIGYPTLSAHVTIPAL
jgi:hypothetical protein